MYVENYSAYVTKLDFEQINWVVIEKASEAEAYYI